VKTKPRHPNSNTSALPIIVIEDDPGLRGRVCSTLESEGYPVFGIDSSVDVVGQHSNWKVTGLVVGTMQLKLSVAELRSWLSHARPDLEVRTVFLSEALRPKQLVAAILKLIGHPPDTQRILVVDDEEPIAEITSMMLGVAGYRCRSALGGQDALKLLDSGESFDLIISDLMNAPMDGITFVALLKQKYPDIPVLISTAVHDVSASLAALRNGAYDYLLKPWER